MTRLWLLGVSQDLADGSAWFSPAASHTATAAASSRATPFPAAAARAVHRREATVLVRVVLVKVVRVIRAAKSLRWSLKIKFSWFAQEVYLPRTPILPASQKTLALFGDAKLPQLRNSQGGDFSQNASLLVAFGTGKQSGEFVPSVAARRWWPRS